jgi:hypothetical protein
MSIFAGVLAVLAMELELEAYLSSGVLALWQASPKKAAAGIVLILLSALISYCSTRPLNTMAIISCLYSKHGKLANIILEQNEIPKTIIDQIIFPRRWCIVMALSGATVCIGLLSATIAVMALLPASVRFIAIISMCATMSTGFAAVIAGVTAMGVVLLGHQVRAESENPAS